MTRFGLLLGASALTLLSACSGGGGGGGIGSTPAPTPAPGSTPTPSPPASNASLLNLTVSETFLAVAATATGYYTDVATCNSCTAAKSTLSIRYDAPAGSYTVTRGDRAQSFGSANRDAGQSLPELDVYTKRSGAVEESLSLTRAGTSGPLTYQYVGAGMWQRVTINGNRGDFTFDSFNYGMPTAATATPRTGFASYDVSLIGALGSTGRGQPIALSGNGTLTADFARGDIGVSGNLTATNSELPITEFTSTFGGSASLAADSSAFSGSFSFYTLTGTLDGRFFGPGAEEVGATFASSNQFGDAAVGSILGRRGTTQSAVGLADLTASTNFQSPGAFLIYYRDPATGQLLPPLAPLGSAMFSDMSYQRSEGLTYDPASGRYAFDIALPAYFSTWGLNPSDLSNLSFDAGNRVAAQSNARFNVYEKQVGDSTLRLTAYRPGNGNDELALTYASFARLEIDWPLSAGRESAFEAYLPYGVVTPNKQMPLGGTASYSGRLYGTAASQHQFGSDWSGARPVDFFDLTGSATFLADFGAGSLTATLKPVGLDRTTGASHNFGDFDVHYYFSSGTSTINSAYNYQAGSFFGPTANEVGVTFRLNTQNPAGNDTMILSGVAVGKRN